MAERVFYDGDCGLCHWSVKFILPRDKDGKAFRFAPIGGETFRRELTEAQRENLPDSLLVLTLDGRLLDRFRAVRHIGWRLGGGWKPLAGLGFCIPAPIGDFFYDRVAANRHRFFERPEQACPLLPPHFRERMDD